MANRGAARGVPAAVGVASRPPASAIGGPGATGDLPIGLVVRDGPEAFEALANADAGPPLGRKAPATGPGRAWYGADRPTRAGQLAQAGSSTSTPYFFIFL